MSGIQALDLSLMPHPPEKSVAILILSLSHEVFTCMPFSIIIATASQGISSYLACDRALWIASLLSPTSPLRMWSSLRVYHIWIVLSKEHACTHAQLPQSCPALCNPMDCSWGQIKPYSGATGDFSCPTRSNIQIDSKLTLSFSPFTAPHHSCDSPTKVSSSPLHSLRMIWSLLHLSLGMV